LNGKTFVPRTVRVPEKITTEFVADEGETVVPRQAAHRSIIPSTHTRVAVMCPFVSTNGRAPWLPSIRPHLALTVKSGGPWHALDGSTERRDNPHRGDLVKKLA
jgi:hypothetical protein